MLGRSFFVGVVLGTFLLASSSLAAGVPRAALVRKADAACKAANATAAHFKNKPPSESLFTSKPTPAKLRAAAGYYAEAAALAQSLSARVFALGTPAEPAASKTWSDWKALTTRTGLPALLALAHAMKKGDVAAAGDAIAKEVALSDRSDRYRKLLGIKVCDFP